LLTYSSCSLCTIYQYSVNGQPDELVGSQARVFIKPGRIVLLAHKFLKICMLNIYLTGIMKTTRTGFSYIAGVFYNKWKRKEKDQMINRSVEMWGFLEDCNLPSIYEELTSVIICLLFIFIRKKRLLKQSWAQIRQCRAIFIRNVIDCQCISCLVADIYDLAPLKTKLVLRVNCMPVLAFYANKIQRYLAVSSCSGGMYLPFFFWELIYIYKWLNGC
jgi:hypothetical protein